MAAGTIRYMGSKDRSLQLLMGIPGGQASGQPGVLVLDTGAASPAQYKLFVDTGGNLRITSGTAYGDSDGTAFASGSGANIALTNLAAVAINTSLVSDAVNTDDLGTDALPWRSAYIRTSLIFDQTTRNLTITASEPATLARTVNFGDPGANDGVVYLAASQALTTKTYDGLTIAASANTFTLTRGTATISLAEGNTDILLGAAAQLDIAAAKTVNIDTNFTVNTVDVTLNQALASTSSPTFNALTVTSLTDGTATLTAGGLTTTGALTCRGITNTTTAITSTAAISILADTTNLNFGPTGLGKIYQTGAHMYFQDSAGGPYSLQQIATGTALNPSVTGDLAIPDGKFTWTDLANEAAGVWTFANTTAIDIAQISIITTGTAYSITADFCANGKLLVLDADGDVGATGYYVYCLDGTNPMFTVGPKGATIIAGNAALTDALTVTAGDLVVTSGEFTSASTADTANKISRNNVTGTAAVLEIEETHITGGTTLLIDSNATDGNDALVVEHDGTGKGLKITGTAVTGSQASFIGPASQTVSSVIVDGTTGSWIGAAGVGMLHLSSDGALANAAASLIYSTYTGNAAGANIAGACAYLVDASIASGTSYALGVSSTNNSGLNVVTAATGMIPITASGPQGQTVPIVKIDGGTGTGWVGAANVGALNIAGDGTMANVAASMLYIAHSGAGLAANLGSSLRINDSSTAAAGAYVSYMTSASNSVLNLVTAATTKSALVITGPAAQTVSSVTIGGAAIGWVGAAATGMFQLDSNGAIVANGSLCLITSAGQPFAANDGVCLEIVETGAAQATSYAVRIASTNNEALHVDTGIAVFDETATLSDGALFNVVTTDVTALAPTDAEIDAGSLGTAASRGAGYMAVCDDANAHATMFIFLSDGTTWHWIKGTKCA